MKGQGACRPPKEVGAGKNGISGGSPEEGSAIVPPPHRSSGRYTPKIAALHPRTVHLMPKASAPPKDLPVPASYEAALEELEQLVGRIENGQMPLEQLLTGYQRGAQLLAFCRERLEAVEDQVKVLDEGKLKTWTQE